MRETNKYQTYNKLIFTTIKYYHLIYFVFSISVTQLSHANISEFIFQKVINCHCIQEMKTKIVSLWFSCKYIADSHSLPVGTALFPVTILTQNHIKVEGQSFFLFLSLLDSQLHFINGFYENDYCQTPRL